MVVRSWKAGQTGIHCKEEAMAETWDLQRLKTNKQPPPNNSLQYSKCPQFHKRYLLCHELTGNHPQILKRHLELYRSLNKIWRKAEQLKLNVASHLK